jgi:hypothetical protein
VQGGKRAHRTASVRDGAAHQTQHRPPEKKLRCVEYQTMCYRDASASAVLSLPHHSPFPARSGQSLPFRRVYQQPRHGGHVQISTARSSRGPPSGVGGGADDTSGQMGVQAQESMSRIRLPISSCTGFSGCGGRGRAIPLRLPWRRGSLNGIHRQTWTRWTWHRMVYVCRTVEAMAVDPVRGGTG